jgi:2-dehydropantoate 2-reductase
MRLWVVGAGAIGGVVGAYLVRAGHEVLFVDRAEDHVLAMRERGLTIQGLEETFTVPVQAQTVEDFSARPGLQDPEAVLLAVKAQHTEDALSPVVPHLPEKAYVVSLQNGLCEQVIANHVGVSRTVGAFVNLFADYLEPGRVGYGGVGSLYIGELDGSISPRLEALQQALLAWGDACITDDIWGFLWSKLAYGTVLTATALVDEAMADVMESLENRPLLFALATEVLMVAERLGIRCQSFDDWEPELVYPGGDAQALDECWARLIRRLRSYKKVKSGIWRDLAVRRRKTEVPAHLGPVLAEGSRLGVAMPLTTRLLEMIQELESGRRVMAWDNIAELKRRFEEVHGEWRR